jgi:trigger factor
MASTELDQTSTAETPEAPKLEFDVKVEPVSACERHVVITIPRAEVDRYLKRGFDEVTPKAELPGFRQGKAPRKLIESRFKAEVAEQVKSSLIMEGLQQVTEGGHFSAISEPDFDYKAIEVPAEGDFRYEFDIEVRPDFETPKWEGLELNRLACELSDTDVDRQTARTLSRFVQGEPVDGEAQPGDVLTLNIRFHDGDRVFSQVEEESVPLRPQLTFGDTIVKDFDKLMSGAREGDRREVTVTISDSAPNPAHRGKELRAEFEVVEIRRIQIDEISEKLLDDLGFQSAEELRTFVRAELERQFQYHQHQDLRKQIVAKLTEGANWDMPESLVNKQTSRELQRMILELQRSGFDRDKINEYINAARFNARASTIEALREHFVLEKIAEELKLEPTAQEYDAEIELLAEQSDVSPRRVRARLEKSGQMDAIRNQIIERQVIERIAAAAKITDKPDTQFLKQGATASSIDFLVSGAPVEIPEAHHENDAAAIPGAPKLPEAERKSE